MKLHPSILQVLAGLAEAGGSADWDDRLGRAAYGPTHIMLRGESRDWMRLVTNGLVGGEGGKVILTEAGRELAATVASGRVREGAN